MKLLFLLQWHIHIKNSQYEPVFERDHSFSAFTNLSFVTNISYPPDTHTYMFVSGCKKYCFSENFANTLNQWSQIIKHKKENINSVKIHFSQNTDTLFYMLPNLPSNFDPINNLVVFIVVFRKPKSYQKFHITFWSYNFLPKRTDFIDYLISCKYYISIPPENIRKPKLFWHFQGV